MPSPATATASATAEASSGLAFQRLLDRARPYRCRRHRAIGDARAAHSPSASGRSAAIESTEAPCGCLRTTLRKRNAPSAGSGKRHVCHDGAGRLRSLLEEGLETGRLTLPAILRRDFRPERQQRHREVAVGRRREEIAADRRHCAHGRPADLACDGVQERKPGMREDLRHRHGRADLRPTCLEADSVEPEAIDGHERADGGVAGAVVADRERSAAEEAGARVSGQDRALRPALSLPR